MKTDRTPATVQMLLALLDEAFERRSWHGTNLRGSLRGLTAEQAAWRLAPGRHSIAQIVVHAAYWKYSVGRRLRGEKRGSFPLKGSNWFALPEPLGETDWHFCLRLLTDQHQKLRTAVAELTERALAKAPPKSKVSTAMLVRGAALHDVYHAGQIQQIKGLQRSQAGGRK